jgi:hypothetical protein
MSLPRSSPILFTTTITTCALYVLSGVVLGDPPGPTASGQEVVDWFAAHGGQVRTYVWLSTVFGPFFATYAALVRHRLPAPHRDVFFVGAIAMFAVTAVSVWIWAGLSWHADQLQPATARVLLDVTSFWGPVLTGVTTSMLAPVVVLSWGRNAVLPRWLGVVGGIALVEQTIETVTIFGRTGFTAPGGPMNLLLGAGLCIIWLLCLGITLSRRSPIHEPAAVPLTAQPQAAAR